MECQCDCAEKAAKWEKRCIQAWNDLHYARNTVRLLGYFAEAYCRECHAYFEDPHDGRCSIGRALGTEPPAP